MRDLTHSAIDRQNILNNRVAVEKIQTAIECPGMFFEGEYRYTKKMVAEFYGVDVSTINRYLHLYEDELKGNGFVLLTDKSLKNFKEHFGHLIDKTTKTTKIGVFNFRAFLNIGMLLADSAKARLVRSTILDIVIEVVNARSGGGTKYINRCDPSFLTAAIPEASYRKAFTSAINDCVDGHKTGKYPKATDFIYKAAFRENAAEYRKVLKLDPKDDVKQTLYAEVLLLIASFENGCASAIRQRAESLGRRLSLQEVKAIIDNLAASPVIEPFLIDARSKMASRDLSLRDALHVNLAGYIKAMAPEDFERFLGKDSIDFDALLEANADVLKRLM